MLWHNKLMARVEAAIITKNRLTMAEKIAYKIDSLFYIYRSVFSGKSFGQKFAFIGGGILLYAIQLPRIFIAVAEANAIGGIAGWYFKWLVVLIFPVGWFVALPMIMFLIDRSRR